MQSIGISKAFIFEELKQNRKVFVWVEDVEVIQKNVLHSKIKLSCTDEFFFNSNAHSRIITATLGLKIEILHNIIILNSSGLRVHNLFDIFG